MSVTTFPRLWSFSPGEQLRRRELLEFHVVDAEPLGPRRLKGFDVTVSVYSLRALKGGAP